MTEPDCVILTDAGAIYFGDYSWPPCYVFTGLNIHLNRSGSRRVHCCLEAAPPLLPDEPPRTLVLHPTAAEYLVKFYAPWIPGPIQELCVSRWLRYRPLRSRPNGLARLFEPFGIGCRTPTWTIDDRSAVAPRVQPTYP